MANQSTILILLKFYATRLNTATVDYYEFSTYVKKYAQIHVEEQPDLVSYLGNADAQIEKELFDLSQSHQILILSADSKRTIFVISMYVQKFTQIYKEISIKPATPFPTVNDLPKSVPVDILNKQNASDFLHTMMKHQDINDKTLYCLSFPHDTPAILFPSSIPVNTLSDICMTKIRTLLQKDEYHDYFAKKLRISNQGKEIATKSFFDRFVNFSDNILNDLKSSNDSFYFWSQLCFFIRQDYESIKDFTPEDFNVLQAVYISEIITSFYKDKIKMEQQKDEAIESLKTALNKPPYYFTMNDVLGFTNDKGVLLRKVYSDEDLKKFLEKETSEAEDENHSKLPQLLVFKIDSGTRYFIYKEKVIPLIIRLSNEAHDSIGKEITDEWVSILSDFEKTPAMSNAAKFEELLRLKTEKMSPILYAILNANFLLMLTYELSLKNSEMQLSLFAHDKLVPYSHILLLTQTDLLSNAKIQLPFWYSVPVISWIISLFIKKPKNKAPSHTAFQKVSEEGQHIPAKQMTKAQKLSAAAAALESRFVQEGSSLERELNSYAKIWNKMIDNQARANLREDVNALIRDYMRNVFSTLNGVTFTEDRLENLANTLCSTPNMKKIGEAESLNIYVRLYILSLLKNLA